MKRLFALLLALVLLVSATPLAGAFTDDAGMDDNYKTAVEEMAQQKIISGFTDGSFKPEATLTRAQAAKILCVLLEGAEKAETLTKTETGFSDVPASHWAAKYVAYCVDKGIVAGVGGGRFDPDGELSGAAFAKMLLVAYGGDSAEFTGEGWVTNVQKALPDGFLNNRLKKIGVRALPRQEAAQMAWNALFKAAADEAAAKDMASRPLPTGVPESIKVLAVGNSFSIDSYYQHLRPLLLSAGVKDVTVGVIYYGGCSLQTHVKLTMGGEEKYTYYKQNTSKIVKQYNVGFDVGLMDEDWDIISFQQSPDPTYQPAKNLLMYYVQQRRPTANFVWNHVWAHAAESKKKTFTEFWDGDQTKMYNGITDCVQRYAATDPRIRFIVPVGTAIQNARTSFLGDHLDRDTYHLNRGIGRYIASLTWCCKLTGLPPEQIPYRPDAALKKYMPKHLSADTPGILDALEQVAKESVKNALANPTAVTQSKFTTAP